MVLTSHGHVADERATFILLDIGQQTSSGVEVCTRRSVTILLVIKTALAQCLQVRRYDVTLLARRIASLLGVDRLSLLQLQGFVSSHLNFVVSRLPSARTKLVDESNPINHLT